MNTSSHQEQNAADLHLIAFLQSIPEFRGLSDDEMEMLDKIMLVTSYPGGHKFKTADNIYLVLDGEVAIAHKRMSGISQLDRMHQGELFGLFQLIDSSKQSATCTAVGSVIAASLPRTAFELLFRSTLPLANRFQVIVAHQATSATSATQATTGETSIPC